MRKRAGYIPELDGFRVVMVFIVAWYHIWQQSWLTPGLGLEPMVRAGYIAVDGTLLLSAFLLYLPWADRKDVPPVRDFYLKRAARVWPSFVFVTLAMLFLNAIPQKAYADPGALVKDLLMHLTLTFPFAPETYIATPLGGASWTIAVEFHFYLLFPWLTRLARRHPAGTLCGMAALAAYFRGWCLWTRTDYAMVINQMANFLDVYALGMACALLFPVLRRLRDRMRTEERSIALQLIALAVLALSVVCFVFLLRAQAAESAATLQRGQMMRRPLFALCFAGMVISLPFCWTPVRRLFGNPVTRFLSVISMNFYLLHQNIAVLLKSEAATVWLAKRGILFSEFDAPNVSYDLPWQLSYTALCFLLSLLAATAVTFLIEKPCARLMLRGLRRREAAAAQGQTAEPITEANPQE